MKRLKLLMIKIKALEILIKMNFVRKTLKSDSSEEKVFLISKILIKPLDKFFATHFKTQFENFLLRLHLKNFIRK